jgi:hypothetical protein
MSSCPIPFHLASTIAYTRHRESRSSELYNAGVAAFSAFVIAAYFFTLSSARKAFVTLRSCGPPCASFFDTDDVSISIPWPPSTEDLLLFLEASVFSFEKTFV